MEETKVYVVMTGRGDIDSIWKSVDRARERVNRMADEGMSSGQWIAQVRLDCPPIGMTIKQVA